MLATKNWKEVPMPRGIAALPVDLVRGFPVPWFVAWLDDGRPEFRAMEPGKIGQAILERRCWVCGNRLDNRATYLIGPMSVVNRVSSEPPSHPACAEYAAVVCPFLTRPHMDRRTNDLPVTVPSAGISIDRNPGVVCLWTGRTPGSTPFRAPGGILFRLHDPIHVGWYAERRHATHAEVMASVESGLPILREMADQQAGATEALEEMIRAAQVHFTTAR